MPDSQTFKIETANPGPINAQLIRGPGGEMEVEIGVHRFKTWEFFHLAMHLLCCTPVETNEDPRAQFLAEVKKLSVRPHKDDENGDHLRIRGPKGGHGMATIYGNS